MPIILANTYHLAHHPGRDVLEIAGGLHRFMNWNRNLLTDSGGFQIVSLTKLSTVSEDGVTFKHPVHGSPMSLTPELSIETQNSIGADIIMALDDVVPSTCSDMTRVEEATHRSLRWLDRCIAAHRYPKKQALFGIVQGALDPRLRKISLEGTKNRCLRGYAIGGLSGGEEKDTFWRIVEQCTAEETGLPSDKPRYLMGVGYPLDIVVCTALGVDMYDCVFPSRTARFGTALVPSGFLRLIQAKYACDFGAIQDDCLCYTCQNFSRAYIRSVQKTPLGSQLITIHNFAYMMRLCKDMRRAIMDGSFPRFVCDFVKCQYPPPQRPPFWVVEALKVAKIDLTCEGKKDA